MVCRKVQLFVTRIMKKWKRPAECRLCQCPVADTGVRMDQLDADKLSEWWTQKLMDAELDLEDIAQQWICQFCLWDARLEHEQYEAENDQPGPSALVEWWDGFDTNRMFFKYYYLDAVIERCFIREQIKEKSSGATTNRSYSRRAEPSECIYCKEMFPSKRALRFHVTSTHQGAIKCSVCRRYFLDEKTLNKHLYSHIRENKQHKNIPLMHECLYCKDKFKVRSSLVKHVREEHKNVMITCNYTRRCLKFFKTQAEKLEHVQKIHTSKADKIECEVCKVKLLRPHLNKHMREFHNRSNTNRLNVETNCCYCQKEFSSRKSAFKHVKEAHSDIKTFKCYDCEIIFETNDEKKEHYQKVHRRNFRCIYCANWVCSSRTNLRRHLMENHYGEIIQCRYSNKCGRLYFKTQTDLQTHIKESHDESDISNKLQCVYCSKYLICRNLIKHMRIHHESIAIRCYFSNHCRSYFLSEKDLQQHIQDVHKPGTAHNKVKCPCCSELFVDFETLKEHAEMVHLKSIEMCNVKRCKFVCTGPNVLDMHVKKQHADLEHLRKYQCPKCDFYNYNKLYMLNHQRMHGTQNFKCHFCPGKNFKSKLSIRQHITLLHSHYQRCCHCRRKFSKFSIKNHRKVFRCQFCNKANPCKGNHNMHERKCAHRKRLL